MPSYFTLDTREFRQTLERYRSISKKTNAQIVNTKAFFIARGATRETPKADKQKVKAELTELLKTAPSAKGRRKWRSVSTASGAEAPLVTLLINKRRGPGRGLYGQAMKDAVKHFIARRLKSIAFMKSGWLPAIKRLQQLADRGGGRVDSTAKQFGKDYGTATPAQESSWKVEATIENWAGKNEGLITYGGPALQRAMDEETRTTNEYMEKKLRDAAKAAGIKTN